MVFWDWTQCNIADCYQHFKHNLLPPSSGKKQRCRQEVPLKH